MSSDSEDDDQLPPATSFTEGSASHHRPEHFESLLPFIYDCRVFPLSFDLSKQDLVALWIAEGLVEFGRAEDVASDILDSLVSQHFIVPSRFLNLSISQVFEISVSIGHLKSLKYLDLSLTPIRRLPLSIDFRYNLQTLKLRFCSNLNALDNNICKLSNLRYLDFDVFTSLTYMPIKMGNLTNLQTLSGFLVDKDDGNRIVELKNIANLTGRFCISTLEIVSSFEEAKGAALVEKRFLNCLEIGWTKKLSDTLLEEENKILEHLQPSLQIEELTILYYSGSKLPTWISSPLYGSLADLILCSCRNCDFLPSIGELPSLQFLIIIEMNELKRIDQHLCRKDHDQQNPAFPILQKLKVKYMSKLEEWTGIQNGDFPVLHTLVVECCPELISLPSLLYLHSLKHLELSVCPNILALLDKDLPFSLELISIIDCSQLKQRCLKGDGQEWGKMAHVPIILVDYEKISWQH